MHAFPQQYPAGTLCPPSQAGDEFFDLIAWILKLIWLLWGVLAAIRRLFAWLFRVAITKSMQKAVKVTKFKAQPLPSFSTGSEFNAWRSDAGLY